MMPEATSEAIAQIERHLHSPGRWPPFESDLELAFQRERAERRSVAFEGDALIGVVIMHLFASVILLARIISPHESAHAYLTIEWVLTIPTLLLVLTTRRVPRLLLHVDGLFVAVSLLALLTALAINWTLAAPIAVYHAFGLCLYPIKLNLRADLPFKIGAPLSLVYLMLLIANVFDRPAIDPTASWCASLLYFAVTVLSLSANYRMEASARSIYLNYVKESLRNEEIVDANRQLDALSRTDALTDLSNRRDFDERFQRIVKRAHGIGETLAVFVLDIDHFKLYNDRFGHPEGDKCLRAVARAIAAAVAESVGFAGRIGGEEFAVALPGCGAEAAAVMASRIRAGIAALRLAHPALGDRRIVTVSIGVACLNPACPESSEALLARADAALYRAKRAGRDRAEFEPKLISA